MDAGFRRYRPMAHGQATNSVPDLKQAALQPWVKGGQSPSMHVKAGEGDRSQVEETADETKHPGEDRLSGRLETACPPPEQLSEPSVCNPQPRHPNEPVVKTMEEPVTVTTSDSVAAEYPPERPDKLLFGINIRQNADRSSQPLLSGENTTIRDDDPPPTEVCPTPDSSDPVDLDTSACKRLISRASLLPYDIIPLIEAIFTSKDEAKMIGDLRGDDAQTFVDVVHEVFSVFFHLRGTIRLPLLFAPFTFELSPSTDQVLDLPDLQPLLRGKCLRALCHICGRQALLPRSLQVSLCYNRLDTPLYRGGFADVWKGEYRGCNVAVKVLRVYSTSDVGKITSVGSRGLAKSDRRAADTDCVEVLQGSCNMEDSSSSKCAVTSRNYNGQQPVCNGF